MTISLICSSKGGCGKSTLCYQFLAPYFYARTKNKPLILDLDKANNEFDTFSASSILESKECDLSNLDTDVLFGERDIIFDTGATSLAKQALDLLDNKGHFEFIDQVFIPITSSKQACSSALDTYDAIKRYKPDAKICFILNAYDDLEECPLEIQFIHFLTDSKHFLSTKGELGEFDLLKQSDPNVRYLAINRYGCLSWGSHLGLTAYEYASKVDDIKAKIVQAIKEIRQDPSKRVKYDLLSNRLDLAKHCKKFKDFLENDFFKQLDEVFNG